MSTCSGSRAGGCWLPDQLWVGPRPGTEGSDGCGSEPARSSSSSSSFASATASLSVARSPSCGWAWLPLPLNAYGRAGAQSGGLALHPCIPRCQADVHQPAGARQDCKVAAGRVAGWGQQGLVNLGVVAMLSVLCMCVVARWLQGSEAAGKVHQARTVRSST